MSLLNYLQFQEIDSDSSDIPSEHRLNDEISLNEPIDESSLENFWEKVDQDIRDDPEWFSFANE